MWRVICAVLCAALLDGVPAAAAETTNGQLAATWGADRLVTFNPDGTTLRTVWRAQGSLDTVSQPAWSPDGNQIAFVYWDLEHGSRIAVHDLRTSETRTVTDHPGPTALGHTQDLDPGWTAGGRVAFRRATYDTQTQRHVLMTVGADGSGLAALPTADLYGGPVSWSSDGWVLYRDGSHALHIASLDGQEDEVLPFAGIPLPAAWSPDGGWLAFADERLGLASLDGDVFELTASSGDTSDSDPAWSPDGGSLVFKRSQRQDYGVQEELRVLDLASGAERKVISGNFLSVAWQPCVAGVTVRCQSQPVGCLAPGAAPGWDPQPLCGQPGPLPPRFVPRPATPAPRTVPPVPAVQTSARLRAGRVTLQVRCATRCTLSARLSVKLNSGRVLKGRTVVRRGRTITVRLKLPVVPKGRKVASARVIGTTTGADGVKRALNVTAKRIR